MNLKPRATVAVLIATYNRAQLLGETLDVLAQSQTASRFPWEVIVVDNNSTDDTRAVVTSRQGSYPVPLTYLLETTQGRSAALNAAIAATTAPLLLCTDDDVRVEPGWLLAGARALEEGADYVGGPVVPIWETPPPPWLDLTRGDLWGTIAILDYGRESFAFEQRRRVPLGANMGIRRSLIDRIGGFRADLGRSNGPRLMGQEVPELLARARMAHLHGVYAPEMRVHHHIPAARLTKRYYRRWWMGKGYSKAILDAGQPVTENGLDLRMVPHLGAVPRFMVSDAVRDVIVLLKSMLTGDACEFARREMRLAFLVGYLRSRGLRQRPDYRPTPVRSPSETPVPATGSSTVFTQYL
jgi:glycosyltransferase involved in cell wall biosynthesis